MTMKKSTYNKINKYHLSLSSDIIWQLSGHLQCDTGVNMADMTRQTDTTSSEIQHSVSQIQAIRPNNNLARSK